MLTLCRYYEGGISSVYLWDMDDGFAGCVLLKKCKWQQGHPWHCSTNLAAVSPSPKSSGAWHSIHVFDVQDRARTAHYKLTSTVILSLGTDSESLGSMDLSGNMVRQVEQDMAVDGDTSHIANIGKMVEDMELKMRNLLRASSFPPRLPAAPNEFTEEVYFGKAKDVVGDLRSESIFVAKQTVALTAIQVWLR